MFRDIFIVNKEASLSSQEKTDAPFEEIQREQAIKSMAIKLQIMFFSEIDVFCIFCDTNALPDNYFLNNSLWMVETKSAANSP